jgi:hypothetical protein
VVKFIVVFLAVLIAGSLLVSLGNKGGSPSAGESGPTSAPYSSGAGIVPPGAQATAVASTTAVGVPDMCQMLTAAEAAAIIGSSADMNKWDTSSSNFDDRGVRFYSFCAWTGHVGEAEAMCANSEDASEVTNGDIAGQLQAWKQEATDYYGSVVIVPNLGSEAYLGTRNGGPYPFDERMSPNGEDELAFSQGSVICRLSSSSHILSGDAQGVSLIAFAHQVAQAIQV